MSQALVCAEGVACARAGRIVVEGATLTLRAGEICEINGPNGSGKSTLLECLAGVRPPERGKVMRVAAHYVGHGLGAQASWTPREALRFWADAMGSDSHAAEAALRRWGLAPFALAPCSALSAGWAKRAALARLDVASRRLWVLDEPFAGLDAAGEALARASLRGHLAAGGAAILASPTRRWVGRAGYEVESGGRVMTLTRAEA